MLFPNQWSYWLFLMFLTLFSPETSFPSKVFVLWAFTTLTGYYLFLGFDCWINEAFDNKVTKKGHNYLKNMWLHVNVYTKHVNVYISNCFQFVMLLLATAHFTHTSHSEIVKAVMSNPFGTMIHWRHFSWSCRPHLWTHQPTLSWKLLSAFWIENHTFKNFKQF